MATSTRLRVYFRYGLAALSFILAGAAVTFFWQNRSLAVPVAAISRDVPIRVFGVGTVEARVMSKIGFEVGATLAELRADHGDIVKKGDVLARLSAGEQEAKRLKATAAVEVASVNIRRAEANIQKAQAVLHQKVETDRRKKALVGRDIVSLQAAEEAERDVAVARADALVAESELANAKAQVADAKAQLQFEETLLRHRILVAPYDARVIERHKEAGSVIKAGDPIFTLVAHDSYWGLAYIDEARAGFLRVGQPVEARLRSRVSETFIGSVVRIGLESDRATEERRVYVRGERPPDSIYLGEQVEFWITVDRLAEALLVPESAVQGFDGVQGRVWTVEDGRAQNRLVRFRHRTEDARLEIVSGLPENARVIVTAVAGLRVGRAISVQQAAQP